MQTHLFKRYDFLNLLPPFLSVLLPLLLLAAAVDNFIFHLGVDSVLASGLIAVYLQNRSGFELINIRPPFDEPAPQYEKRERILLDVWDALTPEEVPGR